MPDLPAEAPAKFHRDVFRGREVIPYPTSYVYPYPTRGLFGYTLTLKPRREGYMHQRWWCRAATSPTTLLPCAQGKENDTKKKKKKKKKKKCTAHAQKGPTKLDGAFPMPPLTTPHNGMTRGNKKKKKKKKIIRTEIRTPNACDGFAHALESLEDCRAPSPTVPHHLRVESRKKKIHPFRTRTTSVRTVKRAAKSVGGLGAR